MIYVVTGSITVSVTATIEAEDEQEARERFVGADCCVESCDDSITFNECQQTQTDLCSVKSVSAEKWMEMSRLDRANYLCKRNVGEEDAFVSASLDFDKLPDRLKGLFI